MTEQTRPKPAETDERGIAGHCWKRRGLIAAAWAAVAAIVARQTTEPVDAGVDGDVVLAANNTEMTQTSITNTRPSGITTDMEMITAFAASADGFGVVGGSPRPQDKCGGRESTTGASVGTMLGFGAIRPQGSGCAG